ncbi:MAG TPA: VanW family protein [Actinomycetes bacterium]|nr:VanW family protein [Actinomycetes bacterium]
MTQADVSAVPETAESEPPAPPAPNPRRRLTLLLLGGGLGALVLAYLIALIGAGNGVPNDTRVLGIDIGGMSASQAEQRLREQVPGRLAETLTVTAGDDQFQLDPAEVGLSIDYRATVEAAGRVGINPFSLIRGMLGERELDPVVDVDETALGPVVQAMAKDTDAKPREGSIRFDDGEAIAVAPRDGAAIDQAATKTRIESAYGRGADSVAAAIAVTRPAIGEAEVTRAMEELAKPAMSAPVTVSVDGHPVQVGPVTLAKYLSMHPKGSTLQLVLAPNSLYRALHSRLAPYEDPAKDATFRIVRSRPRVVSAVSGREVQPTELAAAITSALTKTGTDRVAEVALHTAQPDLTTTEARALGVVEKVSSWTTNFPYAAYRAHNIGQASHYLNGTLVLPGHEFSLNQTIGERTKERGFVAGIIIGGEGNFDKDLGGGVSAVATTTFNAVFYAGLKDVEHHPHSFWITRYPKGTEATVFWGSKDLRFLNDSGHGVFVTATSTNTSVTVTFWGTDVWDISRIEGAEYNVKPYKTEEKRECVPQDGMRGFDIDVWRVFKQNGTEIKREKFHTHYVPATEITCKIEIQP